MTHYPTNLNDGQHIFVFGSNLAGKHGKGAALEAYKYWGACYFRGVGITGNSYAIPTKDWDLLALPLESIKHYTEEFIDFAIINPQKIFLITRIGCGLAGYKDEQIAPMFINVPNNCQLPEEWLSIIKKAP